MKIPQEYPEAINRRKTAENAIVNTKRIERQTMIHKTQKTKDRPRQTPKQIGRDIMCSGRETGSTPLEIPVVLHSLYN